MRFRIHLHLRNPKFKTIPINYQYELSSFIYKTIANGDQNYANWLHQNGFNIEGKQFRLFVFSNFNIPNFAINKIDSRIIIQSDTISFDISFLPERSTEEFVKGIFSNQDFSIGDMKSLAEFSVSSIELLPQPDFTKPLVGKSISPICITNRIEIGKLDYVAPDDNVASDLLKNNLLNKYLAFYGKEFNGDLFFVWKATNAKSKLISIKTGTPQQTKIRGFNCNFSLFTIPELMKIAYHAGIGEKNSMGFGMIGGIERD